MSKRLTTMQFIDKAKAVHGDKYDYSETEYTGSKNKVRIRCDEHGFFDQMPGNHLKGCGCLQCAGRGITTKEFIARAKSVHGNKYDYSLVEYTNPWNNIFIRCFEHGIFEQTPHSHLQGSGCPKCGLNSQVRKRTNDLNSFIKRANDVHGEGTYDYSLVEYVNMHTKVKIRCLQHGVFEQEPNSHLRGAGCPICSGKMKLTTNVFIDRAKQVHGNKYDYSCTNYVDYSTKVDIICPDHGLFQQTPRDHLSGSGCRKCGFVQGTKLRIPKILSNTEKFISAAQAIHGNVYDYSLVNYINCDTKVKIRCLIHGVFEQTPTYHLLGGKCPKCTCSRGERIVATILDNYGIPYRMQEQFSDLRHIRNLKVDFTIYIHQCLQGIIEYNGEQHYESVDYFGGEERLQTQQYRDSLKRQWAAEHNIPMLEIPYWEYDNIETLVTNFCKEIGALNTTVIAS